MLDAKLDNVTILQYIITPDHDAVVFGAAPHAGAFELLIEILMHFTCEFLHRAPAIEDER